MVKETEEELSIRLDRRTFIKGLVAIGAGVSLVDTVRAREASYLESMPHDDLCRTIKGSGGKLLVEQLKASGIKYVFGNPGSTEVAFYDALAECRELNLIMGLHEGIVVSMAHGYSEVTGEPSLVNVHAVVGTAQIGGQLYNAHRDGIPIVVTAGLVDTTVPGGDVVLAPRPGFAQVDINRQFTKQSGEVRRAGGIPMSIRRAIKLASTAPTGPVYLATSQRALDEVSSAQVVDQEHFRVSTSVRPNADQIGYVAEQLVRAAHPMLVTGPQLIRDDAVREAVELADLLAIPVTDLLGDFISGSGFPTQHALFYPWKSLNRRRSLPTPQPLRRCDMLLGLGPEGFFPEGANAAFPASIPSGAFTAAMGLDTDAMSRTRPVDMAVMADMKEGLKDLITAVKDVASAGRLDAIRQTRFIRIAEEVAQFRSQVRQQVARVCGRNPMHPEEVAMVVDQMIDKRAITVHENFSHDASSLSNLLFDYGPDARRRVANSGSALGWGVGAAIGAKLGCPDRQVVLNIGDGSTMFSSAGFWTMARYQIPVLNLIWNNENYQTVRLNFDRYKGYMSQNEEYLGMYLGSPGIDFVKLSESQGVEGEAVDNATSLRQALMRGSEATSAGRPYTIEIRTSTTGPGAGSTWHQDVTL